MDSVTLSTKSRRIENMDSVALSTKSRTTDSVTLSTKSEIEIQKPFDDDFGEDRISQLPDDILLHILSFLPTRDIVTTSALSTRWQSLWTFFTILNLDFDSKDIKAASFLELIQTQLVLIPDTTRIRKFCLDFECIFHTKIPILLSSILYQVMRHKVEEVDFSIRLGWCYKAELFVPEALSLSEGLLSLPHSLFNSESLTSLKLDTNLNLKFPTSIYFPRLKTLHLIGTIFQNHHSAQQLFSGLPVLEELLLHDCYWNEINDITVFSATLHTLTIYDGHCSDITLLRISSPNLQSLQLRSCSYFELVFPTLPSLDNAYVHVKLLGTSHQRVQIANHTVRLFGRICGVKSLTLSHDTLQTISFADLPTFYNLTHLKLRDVHDGLSAATFLDILQKSPNLQSLELPKGLNLFTYQILNNAVIPCLNRSLKSLSISNFQGTAEEVYFLKYILKNANVLEMFSVNCSEDLSKDLKRKEMARFELRRLVSTSCVIVFF